MVIRKRIDVGIPGAAFVTTTVKDWQPVFQIDTACLIIVEYLKESVRRADFAVIGYVIMPSHFHGVFGLQDIRRISTIMKSFKSVTSRRIADLSLGGLNDDLRTDGRFQLWMPRFDDLIVYSEKQLKVKLNYIHENPVRAGLVENSASWKFSSAKDWQQDTPGPVAISKDFSWLK